MAQGRRGDSARQQGEGPDDRRQGGMSWAKALGIGLGGGVGAILTVFLIALQLE